MKTEKKISIAIHGGAGTIRKSSMNDEKRKEYTDALKKALNAGYNILNKGGTAMDAVEKAVISLEDCPLFNAGKGSVFNSKGEHEMDAAIMNGMDLKAGAVAGIHHIKNPIALARKVMDATDHVLLIGEGAMEFAQKMGFKLLKDEYFFNDFRYKQWQRMKNENRIALDHSEDKEKKFGTVGAVALDMHGNLASGVSTGGMTNKKYGRVGDSSIIGAGIYANNKTCAVSCTGSGEFFIRNVVAYDVSCLMEYKGMNLKDACDEVIQNKLKSIGGDGGLIAVDTLGNIAMPFNTPGMYRACRDNLGRMEVSIFRD